LYGYPTKSASYNTNPPFLKERTKENSPHSYFFLKNSLFLSPMTSNLEENFCCGDNRGKTIKKPLKYSILRIKLSKSKKLNKRKRKHSLKRHKKGD